MITIYNNMNIWQYDMKHIFCFHLYDEKWSNLLYKHSIPHSKYSWTIIAREPTGGKRQTFQCRVA